METLKIRVYDGRKLLYDKNGRVENKSQSIKMPIFHYLNKFLKYFKTLGPCLVVIEEVYNIKPGKNGGITKATPERVAELRELLKDVQEPGGVVIDPVKAENDKLVDRIEKLEKLLSEQAKPEKPDQEPEPVEKPKRTRKPAEKK